MSERHTSIYLPGGNGEVSSGLAHPGLCTPEEMIKKIRDYAQYQYEWARDVLTASDRDFRVETYMGRHVQRNKKVLQEGR